MNTLSMTRRIRWAAVGVALLIVLAACGDGADTTSTTEAEAPETTTTTTATTVASDNAGEPDEASAARGGADVPGQTAASFSLYDFRYCEILMTVDGVTEVWGTPGINDCPDEAWNALDPGAIAAEYGASSLLMNGPRYFIVDGAVDTDPAASGATAGTAPELRDFGGLSMTLLATTAGTDVEPVPYTGQLVVRTITWTYKSGTEVYELTDPEGNTYVMQSYALIQDPDLTAADLATLGARLDLPEGWSFSARVLEEDLQASLTTDGAIVITDDFENSYQLNTNSDTGGDGPSVGMTVVNELGPTSPERIAAIQEPGPDGPIYMVNLLKFKDVAEYEDGRATDLTGREAYNLYAIGMKDVLARYGAEIIFAGDVTFLAIGQVEELWDEIGIVRYPNRATLLEMSVSPEWIELSVHRTAGLEGQLNIETIEPRADL